MTYLYINQDKLIFFPRPINQKILNEYKETYKNVEDLSIKTSDGNKLEGWFVKNNESEKSPLVIYFGGNAEEVSHMISTANYVKGWSWALINYRGYGTSTGEPNERNLFDDSTLIFDYLINRYDVDSTKVIAFGRSLGTGVAIYLSNNRRVEGMILTTPYDSMTSVVKEIYPFIPIEYLLKNKFDSISIAPRIKIPIMIIVAENDTEIPASHANNLASKFPGECEYHLIAGAGHNTIDKKIEYMKYISNFLENHN